MANRGAGRAAAAWAFRPALFASACANWALGARQAGDEGRSSACSSKSAGGAVVWGKPSFTQEPQALRVVGSVRICTRSPLGTFPVTQVSVVYSCWIRSTAKVTHLDSQLTNGVTRRIGRWD